MYIVVAVIGFMLSNRWIYVGLAISSALLTYFWALQTQKISVFYVTDLRYIFILGTYFWVGAVFYKFDLKQYLSLSVISLAFVALFCLAEWPSILAVAAWILIPTVTFAFGFAYSPLLNRLIRTGDYSYGIYIYAFPVQQTIASFYPKIPIGLYLLVCSFLTFILAILSWHFVEKYALSLKPRRTKVNVEVI
jgi:peptidoglycan/LPS O-acetylase OafA/YrhL